MFADALAVSVHSMECKPNIFLIFADDMSYSCVSEDYPLLSLASVLWASLSPTTMCSQQEYLHGEVKQTEPLQNPRMRSSLHVILYSAVCGMALAKLLLVIFVVILASSAECKPNIVLIFADDVS